MAFGPLIKGTASSVSSIQKKSEGFIDVFTKTVNGLTSLNSQIETEKGQRKSEIERLSAEHDELDKLQGIHSKVITKINKIFED